MYFESHAHYDDERFDEDRYALIERLYNECGVHNIINIGADIPSSERSIALADKYDFIYAAVGVHPHEADSLNEENFKHLKELTKHKKVVAVGEIGLDFYYDNSPRDIQRYWFKRQLELAKEIRLPVVIHCRDASQECFDIIKESGVRRGVIHCYSGSPEMAEEYVKMGFKIGVGGVVTFKNSKKLVETVERIPMESILIETDSPYLAPIPFRGERNDSSNLKYVVKKIGEIKNLTPEEVADITSNNAVELFFK